MKRLSKRQWRTYNSVKTGGKFTREHLVKNPFEPLGRVLAFIFNTLFKPLFRMLSYKTVGTFYKKGSNPALGSLFYTLIFITIIFIVGIIIRGLL